jgi:CheY-like chemotaxis protein
MVMKLKRIAMNILLIEDNIHLRRTIRYYLISQGHYVNSFPNGKLAFEQISEQIPDLIITDIIMPIMDGYEFLIKIRQTSNTSDIPVIVVSAMSSYYQHYTAQKFGANKYIRKPFTQNDLQIAIDHIAAA